MNNMKYKYQVSIFSKYYPTVALFEHEEDAWEYYKHKVLEYGDEYFITLSKLEETYGGPEFPTIEWY